MKRSQTTIFIIVGILILFAVIVFVYIKYKDKAKIELAVKQDLLTEKKAIQYFFEACSYKKTEDTLKEFGQKGGFLNYWPSNLTLYIVAANRGANDFPYFIYLFRDGSSYALEKDKAEEEIEDRMNDETGIPACLQHFNYFTKVQGWNISNDNLSYFNPNVNITDNSVVILVNFPTRFQKGEYSFILDQSRIEYRLKLGKILSLRNGILQIVSETNYQLKTNPLNFFLSIGLNLEETLANPQIVYGKLSEYITQRINSIAKPFNNDLALIYTNEGENSPTWIWRIIDPMDKYTGNLTNITYQQISGYDVYYYDFATEFESFFT